MSLTPKQDVPFRVTFPTQPQPRRSQTLLPLSTTTTAATPTETDTLRPQPQTDGDIFHLEFYDPNEIHPQTQPLMESVRFFASFCVKLLSKHKRKQRMLRNIMAEQRRQRLRQVIKTNRRRRWRDGFAKLNEQRQNLVKLADYTASIVAPSFLFLTLGALMMSIIPLYYAKCIQVVATADPSASKVWNALLGLTISSVLGAMFTGLRGSLFWIAGSRANYNIRVKLHRNLLLQEAGFFDSTETGYLLSRLNNDVNKIGMVISYHVNVVCRQLAQFLFGSVYLIRISPRLSLVAFMGILVVAWISAVYGAFNRQLSEDVQDSFADATAVAETSFTMSETIRAFNGVSIDSAKYEAAQNKALRLEEVQAWGYGAHKFVSDTLQVALQVLLLFACWRMGVSGGLPAAKLTTFMFYTNFVLESSNEVGDQWAKIQGAVGASTSVFDLIRRIPLVRDPPVPKHAKDSDPVTIEIFDNQDIQKNGWNGKEQTTPPVETIDPTKVTVKMSNMTVTYGAMDVPALNGVDLEIYEGDRVAIVGRSGSGKSSMLRSILRFYDPVHGAIYLGNQPLKEIPRKQLAKRIAVVEQEPHLFPVTLLENVLYGIDKDATDPKTGEPIYSDAYRDAATQSLLKAGLPIHPGNDLNLELDTRVGEGGRSLSGGQRQRVAIARALIRNPQVLLLDEPTAALDNFSEKKVIKALRKAMGHCKSMVMVTHRLGVVRSLKVNRVIVLDKGKIVEQGHPEDLLRQPDGLYASLAREQGIVAQNELVSSSSSSSQ